MNKVAVARLCTTLSGSPQTCFQSGPALAKAGPAVHSHAHRFASASCYTAADLYSMVYETAKAL